MDEQPKGFCLMCRWEPDYKKGVHLPFQFAAVANIWLCAECVTTCKTVDSFGLTVEELGKASAEWRNKPENAAHFTNFAASALPISMCPQCKSSAEVTPYRSAQGLQMAACGMCFIQWQLEPANPASTPESEFFAQRMRELERCVKLKGLR